MSAVIRPDLAERGTRVAPGTHWERRGDDLDATDRAALHEAIREGFEDAKAGRTIDADEWAAELRSRL